MLSTLTKLSVNTNKRAGVAPKLKPIVRAGFTPALKNRSLSAIDEITNMFAGRLLSREEQKPFLTNLYATVVCHKCFHPCFNPIDLEMRAKKHMTMYQCSYCQHEFWLNNAMY